MAEAVMLRRSTRARTVACYNEITNIDQTVAIKTELPPINMTDIPIKTEVAEEEVIVAPPAHKLTIKVKREADDDGSTQPPARKRAKKVKKEESDSEDTQYDRPKRKRATKKKAAEEVPHRLVLTPGMRRPPGEKQLPMIYPVPKRKPVPNLLALKVASFDVDRARIRARIKPLKPGQEEVRLKEYVEEPSKAYYTALDRANTHRLYVLRRERSFEEDCHAHHHDCPVEDILIAGSSGNVYTVSISHQLSCNCADNMFRASGRNHVCKHILYVLHNVLKVQGHLKHQQAFLTSELQEIAKHAPPLLQDVKTEDDGKRKPLESDCPICCMEFKETDDIVWCKAACGQNVHRDCFNQWAKVKIGQVTCPFCRSDWQNDAKQSVQMQDITMPAVRTAQGYLNVRDQLDYD